MEDNQKITENQASALNILNPIKELLKIIADRKLEIEALYLMAGGVSAIRYDKDKVQTSPENYLEKAIADANEKELENEEDMAKIDELREIAYNIIRQMEQEEERTFIINHYMNNIGMSLLTDMMHMSLRKIYYLREDALESFGSIITEK